MSTIDLRAPEVYRPELPRGRNGIVIPGNGGRRGDNISIPSVGNGLPTGIHSFRCDRCCGSCCGGN